MSTRLEALANSPLLNNLVTKPLPRQGVQSQPATKRFFTSVADVKAAFGPELPHDVIGEHGEHLKVDSTKMLHKCVVGDRLLISKAYLDASEETQLALVFEILGRRLHTELGNSGNPLTNSRYYAPGAIAYVTNDYGVLITEGASGYPTNSGITEKMPVELRARAACGMIYVPVEEFSGSSLITDTDRGLGAAHSGAIDLESIHFPERFIAGNAARILAGMMVNASLKHREVDKFVEEITTTGRDWINTLRRPEYRALLEQTIRDEIGEPPLGKITLSAKEIVSYMIDLAEANEREFGLNPWEELTSAPTLGDAYGVDLSLEIAKAFYGEIDTIKDNIISDADKLRLGSDEDNAIKNLKRYGHTLKQSAKVLKEDGKELDPALIALNEVCLELESTCARLISLKKASDEVPEEDSLKTQILDITGKVLAKIPAAKEHVNLRYMSHIKEKD